MDVKVFVLLVCFTLLIKTIFSSKDTYFGNKQESRDENFINFKIEMFKKKSGFTGDEQSHIVEMNNKYRNNTTPSASDMAELKWNDELVKLAKYRSRQCRLLGNGYSRSCLDKIGQNVYLGFEPYEIVLRIWFSESENYNYSTSKCTKGDKNCDSYLTMVSADAQYIGCSIDDCLKSGYKNSIVCVYYPKPSASRKHPYEQGDACDKCGAGVKCEKGLCVKKDITIPEELIRTCTGCLLRSNIQLMMTFTIVLSFLLEV